MEHGNISASFTAALLASILADIASIKSKIPLLINLSAEDRQDLLKLGDKSVAFVAKVVDYTVSHPQFMPDDVSIPELQKDFKYADGLRIIQQHLNPLLQGINDTEMAAGSEAFKASNWYYGEVRESAKRNAIGARGVFEDLRLRYPSFRPETPITPDAPVV